MRDSESKSVSESESVVFETCVRLLGLGACLPPLAALFAAAALTLDGEAASNL